MASLFSMTRVNIISYFSKTLKKLLYGGTTVLVDRYAFSGVAFTAAKEVSINSIMSPHHGGVVGAYCF